MLRECADKVNNVENVKNNEESFPGRKAVNALEITDFEQRIEIEGF